MKSFLLAMLMAVTLLCNGIPIYAEAAGDRAIAAEETINEAAEDGIDLATPSEAERTPPPEEKTGEDFSMEEDAPAEEEPEHVSPEPLENALGNPEQSEIAARTALRGRVLLDVSIANYSSVPDRWGNYDSVAATISWDGRSHTISDFHAGPHLDDNETNTFKAVSCPGYEFDKWLLMKERWTWPGGEEISSSTDPFFTITNERDSWHLICLGSRRPILSR